MAEEKAKTRVEILAELWSVTPEEAAAHEAARLAKRAAKASSAAAVEPAPEPEAPAPKAKKKDDAAIDPA